MTRFLERKDLSELVKQSSGFAKRRYGSLVKWAACIALLIFFVFSLNINRLLYGIYADIDMVPAEDVLRILVFVSSCALVIIATLLIVISRLRYMLHAVEFQTSIFAGATRVNTIFCIIANEKNKIIYTDSGANVIFPKDKTQTTDELFGFEGISISDKEKLKDAIASGKAAEISMVYQDVNNQHKAALVTLSPLEKPSGYFVIKGV